jgi:hypothetical protein
MGGAAMGGAAMGGAAMGGAAMGGAAMGGAAERPLDPSLQPPALRLPQNGRATGSVWSERARRPRFVWDPQPTFAFEIQVDDSCQASALQDCEFPSPEWTAANLSLSDVTPPKAFPVSEEAPVGRRYYWRVRSCTSAACSRWSAVRYVDVGRQRSDFDGDGFADVILPDWGSSMRQGRVLVGFGPEPSSRTVVLDGKVTPESGDQFGLVATPLGDMDADGFADLLLTAAGDQAELPETVYVFFGSATFADASSHHTLLFPDDASDGIPGVAVPAGDVDADGMQDFWIDYVSGPRLYRGRLPRSVSVTPIPAVRPTHSLVRASAGDVTGDGHSDLLAVTTYNNDGIHPKYDLLRGSTTGLAGPVLLTETDPSPYENWNILGDLNSDGFSDVGCTVNHPHDAPSYRIDISWGAETPRLDDRATTWAGGLTGQYADPGGAIAAGDVNADGFEDSLIGIQWSDSDRVQANLYLGGQGSRTAPDAVYAFQTEVRLIILQGRPSAPGDVNGDGFDEVFLVEDYGHTGKLFFGGDEVDTTPDDHVAVPPP